MMHSGEIPAPDQAPGRQGDGIRASGQCGYIKETSWDLLATPEGDRGTGATEMVATKSGTGSVAEAGQGACWRLGAGPGSGDGAEVGHWSRIWYSGARQRPGQGPGGVRAGGRGGGVSV